MTDKKLLSDRIKTIEILDAYMEFTKKLEKLYGANNIVYNVDSITFSKVQQFVAKKKTK